MPCLHVLAGSYNHCGRVVARCLIQEYRHPALNKVSEGGAIVRGVLSIHIANFTMFRTGLYDQGSNSLLGLLILNLTISAGLDDRLQVCNVAARELPR
jgi:hypothetical protein